MTKTITVAEAHELAHTAVGDHSYTLIDRTSYEGAGILSDLAKAVSEHEITAGISLADALTDLSDLIRDTLEDVASGWDLVVASKVTPDSWDTEVVTRQGATLDSLVQETMSRELADSLVGAIRESWGDALGGVDPDLALIVEG